MASKQLEKLFKTHIGYRNSSYGSIGIQSALETVDFECNELENTDIMYTLHEQGLIDEPKYENVLWFIKGMEKLHNESMDAVWLCSSKEDLLENYPDDYETNEIEEVSKYTLPDEFTVLSDLGDQGFLIMMPHSVMNSVVIEYEDEDLLIEENTLMKELPNYFPDMIDYINEVEEKYYEAMQEFADALKEHFGNDRAKDIIAIVNSEKDLTPEELKTVLREYNKEITG